MPKIVDSKVNKPLGDAPAGHLLHTKDGYRKILGDGGDVPICHWCRRPRRPNARGVYWHDEGERHTSKLCHACEVAVFLCMTCAAHDYDSGGAGICCLNPPGPDGVDSLVGDHDRCVVGYEQDERFTREMLEQLLQARNVARLI